MPKISLNLLFGRVTLIFNFTTSWAFHPHRLLPRRRFAPLAHGLGGVDLFSLFFFGLSPLSIVCCSHLLSRPMSLMLSLGWRLVIAQPGKAGPLSLGLVVVIIGLLRRFAVFAQITLVLSDIVFCWKMVRTRIPWAGSLSVSHLEDHRVLFLCALPSKPLGR